MNVLLVEDEARVQSFVRKGLDRAGMVVECAATLAEAYEYLQRTPFDVLILDRMLGFDDSLRAIEGIKKSYPKMKILLLSALSEAEQKIAGLEQGADDYMGKPFNLGELVARIRVLARRDQVIEAGHQKIKLEDLEVDLETQEVVRNHEKIELTSREFKLLVCLIKTPKKIFSREELLDRVWGLNSDPGSNVVEVAITRLRSKVDGPNRVSLIHTKRERGYWAGLDTSDE